MRKLTIVVCLGFLSFAAATRSASGQAPEAGRSAQPRTTDTLQILKTRDGSVLLGRVVMEDADSVRFQTTMGTLVIARSNIQDLTEVPASAMRDGSYWPPNPHATRLFFAPTGRMLARGERYFQNTYLFFLSAAGGVTERVTVGGGLSILPLSNFSDNVFFLTPKVGLVSQERLNVAAGVLAGFAGLSSGGSAFGIVYGVATLGGPDASATGGAGIGYTGDGFADRAVVMLGGEKRLGRRASFITENYLIPGAGQPLISYGIRFFGERLSVDLALINTLGEGALFPGFPFVDFAVRF